MVEYAQGLKTSAQDSESSIFERELSRRQSELERIGNMSGPENIYRLHELLGAAMTDNVTVVRNNSDLKSVLVKLRELKERWSAIGLCTKTKIVNQEILFIRQLWYMLELAEVIALGALRRDESRGAHYKPEFPHRNDKDWLKTTMAAWTPDGPKLSYEPVDVNLIPPRARKYDVEKRSAGAAH